MRFDTSDHNAIGIGYGYGIGGSYAGGGYGGRRVVLQTQPIVQMTATIETKGDLDKAIVRRYLRRNMAKFTYCYEKELPGRPKLEGSVTTDFTIDKAGKVAKVKANAFDANVATCFENVVRTIEFPKPKTELSVEVTGFTMTMKPAPNTTTTASPNPVPPSSQQAPLLQMPVDPIDDYVTGAKSLLVPVKDGLAACFAKQRKAYGVALFDIEANTGIVHTRGTIDDPGFVACVAKLKIDSNAAVTCPVAFGTMPIDDGRTIDITDKAITANGKELVPVDPADTKGENTPGFEPVRKEAEVYTATIHATADAVSITGPTVLRPSDATPMWLVLATQRSLVDAGEDAILAQKGAKGWTLLDAIELPVVPTTTATSTWWGHAPRAAPRRHPERIVILVEKDAISIGTTAAPARATFPHAKLADNLGLLATIAGEVHHGDLDIGVAPDLTFKDFAALLEPIRTHAAVKSWTLHAIVDAPKFGTDPGAPNITIGQQPGDTSKEDIRRTILRARPKIQYCYEKQLLVKADLEGKVTAHFTIKADGTVENVTADGMDGDVAQCVAGVVATLQFPKPSTGMLVVNYPFVFSKKAANAAP